MAGADGLYHCAAWYKVGVPSDEAERINVDGTRHVLEMMCELGIPKGVYTSTVAVFSDTRGAMPDERYRYDGPHLQRVRPHEVAGPLRGGAADDGAGAAARHRPARRHLRARRHQRHAHRARGPVCASACRSRRGAPPSAGRTSRTPRGGTSWRWRRGQPGETYIITGPRHTFEEAFDLVATTGQGARDRCCTPARGSMKSDRRGDGPGPEGGRPATGADARSAAR